MTAVAALWPVGLGSVRWCESLVAGVAAQFGDGFGAAGGGVFHAFQHHDGCSFGQDEAVTVPVERLAGPLGVVVLARQGAKGVESGNGQGGHRSLGAAGENDLGLAVTDKVPAGADGVGPAAARRRDAVVGAHSTGDHGNLGGSHVGEHHGNQEGSYSAGAAVQQDLVLFGEGGYAADAAADHDMDAVAVHLAGIELGLGAGFLGRHRGELGEPIHAPGVLALQVFLGVEALDFGGKAGVEGLGVEAGDVVDAGLAGGNGAPRIGDVQAERADHAYARYHHPSAGAAAGCHAISPGWDCADEWRSRGRR